MDETSLSHLIATLLCALALGGMVFFAAVFAPLVGRRLPVEAAGGLMGEVFSVYYVTLIGLSATAAALLWSRSEATVLAAIAVLCAFTRCVLLPRMNRAREAGNAGDASEAEHYARLHNLSMLVIFAQIAALVAVFIRLLLN